MVVSGSPLCFLGLSLVLPQVLLGHQSACHLLFHALQNGLERGLMMTVPDRQDYSTATAQPPKSLGALSGLGQDRFEENHQRETSVLPGCIPADPGFALWGFTKFPRFVAGKYRLGPGSRAVISRTALPKLPWVCSVQQRRLPLFELPHQGCIVQVTGQLTIEGALPCRRCGVAMLMILPTKSELTRCTKSSRG
ncbi:MAG: hypothetical protein CM15mP120_12490 [Pseudomonadota bacterium]|nr:MAG: hypothetical protein CM15mP120_12490 [Pseudomonadota bacterium]